MLVQAETVIKHLIDINLKKNDMDNYYQNLLKVIEFKEQLDYSDFLIGMDYLDLAENYCLDSNKKNSKKYINKVQRLSRKLDDEESLLLSLRIVDFFYDSDSFCGIYKTKSMLSKNIDLLDDMLYKAEESNNHQHQFGIYVRLATHHYLLEYVKKLNHAYVGEEATEYANKAYDLLLNHKLQSTRSDFMKVLSSIFNYNVIGIARKLLRASPSQNLIDVHLELN